MGSGAASNLHISSYNDSIKDVTFLKKHKESEEIPRSF